MVAKAIEETKGIVTCKRLGYLKNFRLHFVKCENTDPRETYNDISSTMLREVMSTKKGVRLREALDWMALSADLLWRCRSSWISKARSARGCRITFQASIEELRQPEPPRSYEEPPHFDDPPSLDELGISQVLEQSPSTKGSDSPEASTFQNIPPFIQEPQSPVDPPPINNKKRRFSATGLEEDADVSLVAQCTETEKTESCQF